MTGAEWYESMAAAMKSRERCLNAIAKWQTALEETEAEIEALRAGEQTSTPIHAVIPAQTNSTVPVAQFAAE